MAEETTGSEGRAATFADALQDLKRRGSMLLIVGAANDGRDAVCRRLLGETGSTTRRRLAVLTDGDRSDHPALPDSAAANSTSVITYRVSTRSAAVADVDAATNVRDRHVDGGLDAIQSAIDEEIDALGAGDAPDPSEYRICVDGVDALLADHRRDRVFQFLHALSATTTSVSGMCHVHLDAPLDDEIVQVIAPLFDAVIEVSPGPRQRWHLRDPDLTTDWLPVG